MKKKFINKVVIEKDNWVWIEKNGEKMGLGDLNVDVSLQDKRDEGKRKIYYHGTNKKNAESIIKTGFKEGTWFADHLEDALGFGGNHIFEVAIIWENRYKEDIFSWQICSDNKLSKDLIVGYKIFPKRKIMFENRKLRDKVFKDNSN